MKITKIGHSTLAIETEGFKILTDPYFSPKGNLVYRRLRPAAQTVDKAQDGLHLVLLSHHHFDHVDRPFFRSLPPSVPVLAPRQTLWLTLFQGAKHVIAVRPWESYTFGAITITVVPASHTMPTIGFVIEGEGKHIYFAADTYRRPFMKEIGKLFPLDVALMPVTADSVPMTMGENEAILAVQDLAPRVVIPIHLGLQPRLSWMRTNQTPERFDLQLRKVKPETTVVHLREGQVWNGWVH